MALADILSGGGGLSLSGLSGILPTLLFWLKITAGVVIVGGAGFVVYFLFFRFPIKVTLLRSVGGGFKVLYDRARVMKAKDGTRMIVLMRLRDGGSAITTSVPPNSFKILSGRNDHFFFYLDDNGQLQNVPFSIDSVSGARLKLWAEDKLGWARKEDKRRLEKYRQVETWKQLAPYVALGMTMMIIFLICYFAFTTIGSSFEEVARLLADLISILQKTVG